MTDPPPDFITYSEALIAFAGGMIHASLIGAKSLPAADSANGEARLILASLIGEAIITSASLSGDPMLK